MNLDEEMKLWKERANDEFGKVLKKIKKATKDYLYSWEECGIEYNVLSDETRRAEYDSKLQSAQENLYGNSEFLKAENDRLKQELARIKGVNPSEITNTNTNYSNYTEEEFNRLLHEKINEARQKAYHDAYVDDMKRRGYHVVYHETPKQKLKKIVFVVIYILVIAIILRLPPVRNAIREAMPFLTTNGV